MTLMTVLDRALAGKDLTEAEGLQLLQSSDAEAIERVRAAADQRRQQLVGDTVTYVVNRNLNYTNIC
ncbi:MAG: 7,8-didemethyl-8-hydroxy-5-deazariboflavin synthase subunit CofH, partial [Cyanobacteria bacterium J06627_15]